jgi:hypothetical protein
MPNQHLASKTFTTSHACRSPIQKFNSWNGLSIWLCMQMISNFKEIQNENETKLKIIFCLILGVKLFDVHS